MAEITKVFGIDLGTTYSAVAHIDEFDRAIIVPNTLMSRRRPRLCISKAREIASIPAWWILGRSHDSVHTPGCGERFPPSRSQWSLHSGFFSGRYPDRPIARSKSDDRKTFGPKLEPVAHSLTPMVNRISHS